AAQRDPAQQQHRAGELLAARDIAFLARVADLFRGRLLGLVRALVLLGHAMVPWLRQRGPRLAWGAAKAELAGAGRRRFATDDADDADEHGLMQMGGCAPPGTAAIRVI